MLRLALKKKKKTVFGCISLTDSCVSLSQSAVVVITCTSHQLHPGFLPFDQISIFWQHSFKISLQKAVCDATDTYSTVCYFTFRTDTHLQYINNFEQEQRRQIHHS